jgi:gamma-glutamylcyclotransferase (GGCT)/AIG2-like uncharacterized protein YtfP
LYSFTDSEKRYGNHRLLENSKFIGNAKVRFEKISSCGFPMIKFGNQESRKRICGEVYKIDDETLENLDALEGEGSLYKRITLLITLLTGQKIHAYTYEIIQDIEDESHRFKTNDPEVSDYEWSK